MNTMERFCMNNTHGEPAKTADRTGRWAKTLIIGGLIALTGCNQFGPNPGPGSSLSMGAGPPVTGPSLQSATPSIAQASATGGVTAGTPATADGSVIQASSPNHGTTATPASTVIPASATTPTTGQTGHASNVDNGVGFGQPQPYVSRQYPTTPGAVPVPAPMPGNTVDTYGSPFGSPMGGDVLNAPPPAPMMPPIRDADLIVNGYPARTGRIMFGGAVNSDAGVTGQITIDERNFDITRFPTSWSDLIGGTAFRGAGQTLRIEAVPGSQFQRYTASFGDPNLFGYLPISMNVSGFLYDRRFDDWDEERLGGRLSFGYRITPDLSISLGISGQNVDVTNPRVLGIPQLDNALGDNELYSGQIALVHDTRDSPIQAGEGHYFEFSFEEVFGDYDYARFETEFRQYWLLAQRADGSGRQTLSYSTQIGISGEETPIFENFFAGGYATMRGFDFRGASPSIAGVEVGGRFQWLNAIEYMFPITADDAFRGVAFVDFGTVEQDIEINKDNFRVAPGVGLRVAIPMMGPAPLAFDFAFPVAKADTDDERTFSFYMSLIR
ncbi:Translocation and assembly module TamA precursor [Crateriforma conspicua]|uniref:Translocation and assembly module TamA n=1 Tax=Crateriforma conspicua TaxID=2527996 RepID=A0A5C6FVM8_9PLAN|nr:outer membrane protein assembly factor [Crateriforma conspicua]TWU65520.1 Translocation and assembly module TamA precursor [Crateriforma conspicua]